MDIPNLKVLNDEVEFRSPPMGFNYGFVKRVVVEKGKHIDVTPAESSPR